MKKILLLSIFSISPFLINAQCSAQTTVTNVTCYNACNGTATITPSGGTGPYTYLWSPGGQTTQTVTGLCAGAYTANVIDANACSATNYITITQPAQITFTYSVIAATCSGCLDGSATVVVTGGNGPFTYTWIPSGGTGATATGLDPGTYSVTITDSNGCMVGTLVTIANSVGIVDQNVVEPLTLSPNPSSDFIVLNETFRNPAAVEISVINLLGEIIFQKTISSSNELHETIQVDEFPSGIFFVTTKTSTGSCVQRFVKQ